MSISKRVNIDFNEIFSKSNQTNIKIPGIDMSDSESSSSDTVSDHGGFLKNKKIIKTRENVEEYIPTCSSPGVMKNLMESYIPKTIGGDSEENNKRVIYNPRTPSPHQSFPENITSILSQLAEKKMHSNLLPELQNITNTNVIATTNNTTSAAATTTTTTITNTTDDSEILNKNSTTKPKNTSSRKKSSKSPKDQHPIEMLKPTHAISQQKQQNEESSPKSTSSTAQKRKIKKTDSEKDEISVTKAKRQKTDLATQQQSSQQQQQQRNKQHVKAPSPSSSTSTQTSMIKISDEAIWLVKLPKKSVFDVNIHMPVKYFKNILPIFNKGVRTDIFVQRDKQETMWANISIKNTESIKLPLSIYKIVSVDENIINNLPISMNNNVKFVEPVLNNNSDKNNKIFDESGIIRIGLTTGSSPDTTTNGSTNSQQKDLYANARIELKKNITYIFNLSLNVVFAKNYINVNSDCFKCSLHSRSDNNYLVCLVINVIENFTIENGTKLMHYI